MGYAKPDIEAAAAAETVCISLTLPDNPEILRAFWAQLFDLSNWHFWGEEKTRLPEEVEARKAIGQFMLDQYILNRDANIEYVCDSGGVEAPFWDDEPNADGDGEGERWGFTEAADWVTTAFLAVAVNPGAAMFYKTVIPRGRIALKTHDFGGLARILIDGIMAVEVDTAADIPGVEGVVQVEIDFEEFAADHALLGTERTITIEKVG